MGPVVGRSPPCTPNCRPCVLTAGYDAAIVVGTGETIKMIQQGTFPNMILRIIEEFTDGFVILDNRGEIVFFNEVFVRLTGWRSGELLSRQAEILGTLTRCTGGSPERAAQVVTPQGPRRGLVACFAVDSDRGLYRLLRVKPADDETEQQQYELLFNNIGDALVSVDLAGRVVAANPSYYRLISCNRESAPRTLSELYINRREFDNRIMRLLEDGAMYNSEITIRAVDGQLKRVLDTAWVNRNENSVVTGYTCQLRDITYLRNLEQRLEISERNYLVLFDTVLSSIVIVDPDGMILNWNYGAEELYGYQWNEVVGRPFDAVFGVQPGRPALRLVMGSIADNNGRFVETGVPRACKDGSTRYVYTAYSELRNSLNELLGYSIMERDLTESVRLEQKLKESFAQIKETQSATILGFARLTEYRDKDTGRHLERIRDYTRVLASRLRDQPRYSGYVTDRYVEDLCLSAILHDVGKVAVEDSILLKPGKLTPEEYGKMKEHARLGGDALSVVDREIRQQSFLTLGKEIAYYHHEWWNGSGYPEGRRGEEIPLSARIVAVADVYDALTSERPYKKAFSHEEATDMIVAERATHFDPDVVDVFAAHHETFRRIKLFNEFEQNPETIGDLLDRRK
jgi:PAS domain S-box-containing protein